MLKLQKWNSFARYQRMIWITESWNGWSWKGHVEDIMFNPLLRKGQLEVVAQDCGQMIAEYLQGGRLH